MYLYQIFLYVFVQAMSGGRHSSHSMRMMHGVQQSRVSDLTKKRLAEARAKAAQAQKL